MRHHLIASLLTTCCLAGLPALAQQTGISPLAPIAPAVQPTVPAFRGVDVAPLPSQQPAAPSEPATTYQQPAPRPDPLYILNAHVIIDNGFLNIMAHDIAKLDVYKGGPDTPRKWRSLTQYGIINITLKDKAKARIKTRTLAEIGEWLQVSGPVSYSINGMPVGESDLRIATVAIGAVQVTRPSPRCPLRWLTFRLPTTRHHPLRPTPPASPGL